MDSSGTRTWEIHDALGSVRQTLDDAATPLGSASYTPFGVPQVSTPDPFGFTGELHSQGLVYLRARWYDPSSGVFVGRDPFAGWNERPDTLHPYLYVGNSPINVTDPSGNCYPPIGWLRNAEPQNCSNLDKSLLALESPHATQLQRNVAKLYIGAFAVGHASLLAGVGILGGKVIVAGSGAITAISQWGSAYASSHIIAGTTTGTTIAYTTVALEAAAMTELWNKTLQGDKTAATMLTCPILFGLPPWGLSSMQMMEALKSASSLADDVLYPGTLPNSRFNRPAPTTPVYNNYNYNSNAWSGSGDGSVRRITIRELERRITHSPATSGHRPHIKQLSDNELLEAVRNPMRGDYIQINKSTGKIVDGNGRAYELVGRARSGTNSKITWDTEVPYTEHDPLDSWYFPDME